MRSNLPIPVAARSKADLLLGLRVFIPQEAWMSVCFEFCVLSGRGIRVGLIIRTEDSYQTRRGFVSMSVIRSNNNSVPL